MGNDAAIRLAQHVATSAHDGQRDKLGAAYIHHPEAVAGLVGTMPTYRELSSDEQRDILVAAWLHDTLEDTHLTPQDLLDKGLPERAVRLVAVLTHQPHESRDDYYSRILKEPLARFVKVADIAHNSSPERLRWLDTETRQRLERKYQIAAERLIRGSAERAWFQGVLSANASR